MDVIDERITINKEKEFITSLTERDYLLEENFSFSLIQPHGGKLINRCKKSPYSKKQLNSLNSIKYLKIRS